MSTAPSVVTSEKCSKIHLDSVGRVKVGHLHPPPDPTSGVGLVTILVTGIACGCGLYPVLSWCTPGRDIPVLARISGVLEWPLSFRKQNLLCGCALYPADVLPGRISIYIGVRVYVRPLPDVRRCSAVSPLTSTSQREGTLWSYCHKYHKVEVEQQLQGYDRSNSRV